MKQVILLTLLSLSVASYGQSQKWQLSFQLQPEMTFHKASYVPNADSAIKSTFNIGAGTLVQYNINNGFFINGGIGFISRTLQTAAVLDQAALPPPNQSITLELVTTKSVSYRVLSVPVNLGYYFVREDNFKSFVTTGISGNYLLNAQYTNATFPKYDGTYKKNHWQGHSVNVGLGAEFKISRSIDATSSISYSIVNKVNEDEYLRGKNGNATLTHNFLTLNVGIKIPL